ncbi:hypothetical protein COY26_01585 [Candidatus Woesearchaeota archaeon CG_4_10_14_0_2_um_filter_33_10]|nr:MAG: hypothetical protein AUJ83_03930 [Candidatus Woesearchaeota archaeon CG1_02_33_12]PIZ53565.1 MAG: hypothetical protein COY26_01585 [Candidatus Woesearchaeota archaeon CG_4_10_14_0_2_um_filter_33_10]
MKMIPKKLKTQVVEDISVFGALPFYLFLSIFVMLLGEIKLFLWLIIGLFLAYGITILIRAFYYKDRPTKENYNGFIEKINTSSFPSLHSLRVTLIFCLFGFYYKSVYLTILFFFIMLLVFFSRYNLKKHFKIDIIFGFVLGVIESFIIVFLF